MSNDPRRTRCARFAPLFPRPASWPLRVAAGLAVLSLATAGVAVATQGSGNTSANLAVGAFDDIRVKTHVDGHKVEIDTKGRSDVYVVSNVFEPGGHSGWHTHPGPSLITVKTGTITVYGDDDPTCTPMVVTAGNGFVDPGDGSIHNQRNEGTLPAETVAFQILPRGAVRRIDAPAPGNCTF